MRLSRRELLVGRLRRALAADEGPPLRGLRRGIALTDAPERAPDVPPRAAAPEHEESTPPWRIRDRSPS